MLLLATRNAGKLRELEPLLATHGFRGETLAAIGLNEEPAEEALERFDTFEGNARAKARWFAAKVPHRVVLAEDSGLVVDALDGAPGVRSKRWSGRGDLAGALLDHENNRTLLAAMASSGGAGALRTARYECAVCCIWEGGETIALGSTDGEILRLPRGDEGFGYDPYFLSDDLGLTFAEATREAKGAVSHRGRAVAAALVKLTSAMRASPGNFTRPVDRHSGPG